MSEWISYTTLTDTASPPEMFLVASEHDPRSTLISTAQPVRVLVNTWSRSRPNQAVLDGTPEAAQRRNDLQKRWSERCPCLP